MTSASLIIKVKEDDVERTRHSGKRVWVGLNQGNYDRPYDVGEGWDQNYDPNDAFFKYGHRHRVFHIVQNGAKVGGVAVRERKGLKDLMALFPATEDGARQFLVRYRRDFPSNDTPRRVVYVPPEDIITTVLRVQRAVRRDCYWFGYSSRAVEMVSQGHCVQHEEYVFSPTRTDRTPVLVPVEFRKGRPRPTFVIPHWNGWDEKENVSFVFLGTNGKEIPDYAKTQRELLGVTNHGEMVAGWWCSHAKDTRGWLVEDAWLNSITGSRHEMEEGPWSFHRVLPRLPPRFPDDAEGRDFKEQIVMKAFHPDIVSKRLLEYGDDWLERV